MIGRAIFPYMFDALLALAFLASVGFATRLRNVPTALAWAALSVALTSMSVIAGFGQLGVSSTRGAQWFMPLGMLGVSLLAFGNRGRERSTSVVFRALLTTTAVITWFVLLGSNLTSVVRTNIHVNENTRETEHTIRYFDSARPPWTTLRAELAGLSDRGVLLSGFKDTSLSHTIGEGL